MLSRRAALLLLLPVIGWMCAHSSSLPPVNCGPGLQWDPQCGCVDVNECQTNNGGCAGTRYACFNTLGSYQCVPSCAAQYHAYDCKCVAQCPACAPLLVTQWNLCIAACPAGFVQVGTSCTECPVHCEACSASNPLHCTTCAPSYYLTQIYLAASNACTKPCVNAGFYANNTAMTCTECGANCQVCSSATRCKTCLPGHHLQNNGQCNLLN